MTEIIYINVISAARICSGISLIAGFIISVMITVPAAVYGLNTVMSDYSMLSGGDVFIPALSDIALLTFLITLTGCLCGLAVSFFYNLLSAYFGGLEVLLLDEEDYIEENLEENPIGYE
ncbi:MAG: hypothetical protein PHP13_01865 [Methanomicrobium sp.]|nr:hypothetical protein [Methanomicrobium sp.]MDD4299753.1 hypothetical protein [Methanomicrobium sp.]